MLTMPLFASERSAGTLELMELLPIPLRKVVIGKFAATFLSLCLAIAGSFVPWALLTHTLGARAPANAASEGLVYRFSSGNSRSACRGEPLVRVL